MPEITLRKKILSVEEIYHEGGPARDIPHKRAYIAAVISNPYAGRYVEKIMSFMDDLKPLGLQMARDLIAAIGGKSVVQAYGKAALIGEAGELEHAALWHGPGGYSMRELLPNTKAIVPSSKKVGGPGARIDVPITHTNASYVRSHFDSIEIGVNDAPRKNEMVVMLAMTSGARVHNRSGGLDSKDIRGNDGLK